MNEEPRNAALGAVYPSLRGRKVIVSGGASGIGEGIVEGFVRQGAAVAFLDILEEPGRELVERLSPDAEIAPHFVQCDITDCDGYAAKIDGIVAHLGGCEHFSPSARVADAGF